MKKNRRPAWAAGHAIGETTRQVDRAGLRVVPAQDRRPVALMYFWTARQAVIPFTFLSPNLESLSIASKVIPFFLARKMLLISLRLSWVARRPLLVLAPAVAGATVVGLMITSSSRCNPTTITRSSPDVDFRRRPRASPPETQSDPRPKGYLRKALLSIPFGGSLAVLVWEELDAKEGEAIPWPGDHDFPASEPAAEAAVSPGLGYLP